MAEIDRDGWHCDAVANHVLQARTHPRTGRHRIRCPEKAPPVLGRHENILECIRAVSLPTATLRVWRGRSGITEDCLHAMRTAHHARDGGGRRRPSTREDSTGDRYEASRQRSLLERPPIRCRNWRFSGNSAGLGRIFDRMADVSDRGRGGRGALGNRCHRVSGVVWSSYVCVVYFKRPPQSHDIGR